jgi:hypothetical protein
MTLGLIYSFETQYRPTAEERDAARAEILQALADLPASCSFFDLVAKTRKTGMRDNLFDYVFWELRREKKFRLNDDHSIEVFESAMATA